MTVKGLVIDILDVEVISDNFSKRTLVVETQETYPQQLPIEFVNGAIEKIKDLCVGSMVEVDINLRGKSYVQKATGQTRYISSINGWRVKDITGSNSAPAAQAPAASAQAPAPQLADAPESFDGQEDDLLF